MIHQEYRKSFFRAVIPALFAFTFSGIYTIADGFFIGTKLGDDALAAMNVMYPMIAIMQALGTGLGLGASIAYSISKGSPRSKRRLSYIYIAISLAALLSVFFFLFYTRYLEHCLLFLGATKGVKNFSIEYMRIVIFSSFLNIGVPCLLPLIRNLGFHFWAMITMILGFLTNISLDFILVWKQGLGMFGASLATSIGQSVTLICCLIPLIYFLKKDESQNIAKTKKNKKEAYLRKRIFRTKDLRFLNPQKQIKKRILFKLHKILFVLHLGFSPFSLYFMPNLILLLMNKTLASYGSNYALSTYATLSYISYIVFLLLQGLGDGAQPEISLAYGERNIAKLQATKKLLSYSSFFIAIVSALVLLIFPHAFIGFFGASKSVQIEILNALPYFAVSFIFAAKTRSLTAYFYATNQTKEAKYLIYGEGILLFLLLLTLSPLLKLQGIWLSIPLSSFFTYCLALYFAFQNKQSQYLINKN